MRHVVQFVLIDKYLNGEKVKDVSKDIELWIKNKDNYIKYNKYDELEKQITHYLQPLELDAYAFTIAVFIIFPSSLKILKVTIGPCN